jgi:hypothetical protein
MPSSESFHTSMLHNTHGEEARHLSLDIPDICRGHKAEKERNESRRRSFSGGAAADEHRAPQKGVSSDFPLCTHPLPSPHPFPIIIRITKGLRITNRQFFPTSRSAVVHAQIKRREAFEAHQTVRHQEPRTRSPLAPSPCTYR